MSELTQTWRGLTLLVDLNFDRIIYVLAIVGGLALGSYVGSSTLMGLQ